MRLNSLLLIVLISLSAVLNADSLDDYISSRQGLVKLCLSHIDYDSMKLPAAKKAFSEGSYRTALLDIVNYYKGVDRTSYFDYPQATPIAIETADTVLMGMLSIMGIDGEFIRNSDGLIDWDGLAETGNEQWPGLLSRHLYMLDLLAVYSSTSNEVYIDTLNSHLCDFILQAKSPMKNLQPDKVSWAIAAPETWHEINEDTVVSKLPKWYTLNAAIRVGTWLKLFYGMQNIEYFEDETRAMMLVSLFEHCNYVRWHHRDDGNWKVGEMKALVKAAVCFQEFTTSQEWLTYSVGQLSKELQMQVYPDGVQKELSASYHRGVLNGYVEIEDIFERSGRELPPEFAAKIQKMYEYLAISSRNSGYAPVCNDSDNDYVAPLIRKAAEKYKTYELLYISTFGEKGKWSRPGFGTVFDYSGEVIFRNGYAEDSDWSFFDIGPWGIGHQHNDKLHLSVSVGGRDILVDPGRYTYNGYHDLSDKWRNYFTSSDSHNVVLIDGVGQSKRDKEILSPIDTDDYYLGEKFSFARGTYDDGFNGLKDKDSGKVKGSASHTRNLIYVPEFGWIVVDTIDTDMPREIGFLWHFHPDCTVSLQDQLAFTNDAEEGNLLIMPASDYRFGLTKIKGKEQPPVQGWYSEKFSEKVQGDVAIYKAKIDVSSTFVWLLVPHYGVKDYFENSSDFNVDTTKNVVNLRYSSKEDDLRAVIPIKHGRPKVVYKHKK
ncbi:MAG: alginate lyase family protein [Sedimentisphaeraceae bacterium JB056]